MPLPWVSASTGNQGVACQRSLLPGKGLLLFFHVDDFDRAPTRARALVTRLEEEPHVNPNTQTPEFSVRDPDGYYVTISALSARSQGDHGLAPGQRQPPSANCWWSSWGGSSAGRRRTSGFQLDTPLKYV